MADSGNIDVTVEDIKAVFDSNSVEIRSLYHQYVPGYLSELKEAAEARNQEQVSFRSHKLCSAMKTIGFLEAASLLEQIERSPPDHETLMSWISQIETLVISSINVLENQYSGV